MGNETASARKRCGRRRAPEPRTGCHCARGNESPASRFTELEPDSAAQAIVAQDRSISHQRKKTVSGSRTTQAPTAPAFPIPYSPFPLLFASIVGKKLVAMRFQPLQRAAAAAGDPGQRVLGDLRSDEHPSEPQSLMRI